MTTARSIMLVAAVLFATACSSKSGGPTASTGTTNSGTTDTFGGSATATSVDVAMPGNFYQPNKIDIAQGGTLRFIFTGIAHDVRFNGAAGAPTDILVTSDQTVSRTFSTKGTYAFLCTLHSNMTGSVTVH